MPQVHPALSDEELLQRLRAGDEAAFMDLVDRYGPLMLRIALMHVSSRAVAEEVVQDSWLGVLKGLDRFEGRSSLKTWITRIVANQARTRGERERRSVPVSALTPDDEEPAVDPSRFRPFDDPRYPGGWSQPPDSWPEERLLAGETLELVRDAIAQLPPRQQEVILLRDVEGWEPEERLLAGETLELVRDAIARLPPRQQEVILLRDVEGWEPDEVSDALGLSAGNQRVLLHRARSKVRNRLEDYLGAAA